MWSEEAFQLVLSTTNWHYMLICIDNTTTKAHPQYQRRQYHETYTRKWLTFMGFNKAWFHPHSDWLCLTAYILLSAGWMLLSTRNMKSTLSPSHKAVFYLRSRLSCGFSLSLQVFASVSCGNRKHKLGSCLALQMFLLSSPQQGVSSTPPSMSVCVICPQLSGDVLKIYMQNSFLSVSYFSPSPCHFLKTGILCFLPWPGWPSLVQSH